MMTTTLRFSPSQGKPKSPWTILYAILPFSNAPPVYHITKVLSMLAKRKRSPSEATRPSVTTQPWAAQEVG